MLNINGMRLAVIVRNIMTEKGLTERQLANRAGVSVGTVRKLYSGDCGDVAFYMLCRVLREIGFEIVIRNRTED